MRFSDILPRWKTWKNDIVFCISKRLMHSPDKHTFHWWIFCVWTSGPINVTVCPKFQVQSTWKKYAALWCTKKIVNDHHELIDKIYCITNVGSSNSQVYKAFNKLYMKILLQNGPYIFMKPPKPLCFIFFLKSPLTDGQTVKKELFLFSLSHFLFFTVLPLRTTHWVVSWDKSEKDMDPTPNMKPRTRTRGRRMDWSGYAQPVCY